MNRNGCDIQDSAQALFMQDACRGLLGFCFLCFERSQKYGLVCEISYILNLGRYFGGQTEYVPGIPFCGFYTNIFSPVFRPKVMTVSVRELFKFCNLI